MTTTRQSNISKRVNPLLRDRDRVTIFEYHRWSPNRTIDPERITKRITRVIRDRPAEITAAGQQRQMIFRCRGAVPDGGIHGVRRVKTARGVDDLRARRDFVKLRLPSDIGINRQNSRAYSGHD